VIIDLVDACKPGCIKYDNVKTGATDEASIPRSPVSVTVAVPHKECRRVFYYL